MICTCRLLLISNKLVLVSGLHYCHSINCEKTGMRKVVWLCMGRRTDITLVNLSAFFGIFSGLSIHVQLLLRVNSFCLNTVVS